MPEAGGDQPVDTSAVEPWELPGSDGRPIFGNTHRPPAGVAMIGRLVICHGFKGYMDYGFLPRLADAAAAIGFAAHRFNFSHGGVTRDFTTFARPDLFERDTWQRQVHDLTAVVEGQCPEDGRPLALFGHSRGGVTALLTAARLPAERVTRVITAASPADAARLEPEARDRLLADGRLASPSGRTGQTLYVGRNWLTEIEADPAGHNPRRASAALGVRAVHLHGDADPTVDPADLDRYAAANPAAVTRRIAGANHVFNAPNPLPRDAELPGPTAALFDAVRETLGPLAGALWRAG
ncbi:MAG: alpha/beta fold hydrolase [Planctomycetota bacterium]